MLKPCICL